MSFTQAPRRPRALERVLIAALVAVLATSGCGSRRDAGHRAKPMAMSEFEQGEADRLQNDYHMTSGDAATNIMLNRYARAGHTLHYAGNGLYEVQHKTSHEVIATFSPKMPSKHEAADRTAALAPKGEPAKGLAP